MTPLGPTTPTDERDDELRPDPRPKKNHQLKFAINLQNSQIDSLAQVSIY